MPPFAVARRHLAAAALLAVAASPALAQRAKAPARPASAEAIDPSADYRLSMANIERLVPLAKNLVAVQNDANVRAYFKDKKAELDRQKAARAAAGRGEDDAADMETVFQLLDGQPKIHQAFASAGITPRDYALTTLNLGVNWMAVVAEDQIGKKATPPSGVAGANWTLVHQNRARIAQIMDELNKYPLKFDEDSNDAGL